MSAPTASQTLAGPPADCCVKGFKHDGDPVGRRETIAGVETYISDPPKVATGTAGPKKVILYFSDIFGAFYINVQLLQDYYASHGFYVLGIDYLFGDYVQDHMGVEPDFDMLTWAHQKLAKAREHTPGWIDAVRGIHGEDAQYFCAGHCFGGPFVMDLAATDKVVAAAFGHPAFLEESHFRALKKPLLLSCAETDGTFPSDARHKAEDILAEIKATYHVQVFSGVSHGFATRGDITEEPIRWAREQSAESIATWFKRFSAVH